VRAKRRLAVIFGGRSAEHEVSLASAQSVMEALDPDRYEVLAIGIDRHGKWHRVMALPGRTQAAGALPDVRVEEGPGIALAREPGDHSLVDEDGTRREIDVVFPLLHGPFGEDGTIQGVLEMAGVPYVGAGVLGSALGMDKAVQKVLFTAAGLPVGPYEAIQERDWEEDREAIEARVEGLGLPVFVKPATLGSSVGITKVKHLDDLTAAMEEALSYARKVVVERSIEGGREIECAVLGNDDPVASVPGEVIANSEFYDYRAKYIDEGAEFVIPADLSPAVTAELQRMAVAAFQAIDAAGMARVDFFVREPDEILVNEINTIPGFTSISMYPKLWDVSGVTYRELVDRLVELAIERHEKERKRGRPVT
jgi:D-alanine-D-alanine ligase